MFQTAFDYYWQITDKQIPIRGWHQNDKLWQA